MERRSSRLSSHMRLIFARQLLAKPWQREQAGKLDFEDEQAIVDEVHTDTDRDLAEAAMDVHQQGLIWQSIFDAMEAHERSHRRET